VENYKIKRNCLGLTAGWNNKEWYFTGVYDLKENLYFSFFFFRHMFKDMCSIKIFNLADGTSEVKELEGIFREANTEELNIVVKRPKAEVIYVGSYEKGWIFNYTDKDTVINVNIQIPSALNAPLFRKNENNFTYQYYFILAMQARAFGEIQLSGKKYNIENAFTNLGHAWGHVPRKTCWHWLVVQNEQFSLYCLVNYGLKAQLMTQVLYKGKWIRLNKSVDVEHYNGKWSATSADLDLNIEIIAHHKSRKTIPPILPLLIDVRHDEMFVKVSGSICIGSVWVDTGDLYGTMEEHFGHW
jgi:hypothetical protein